MTATPDDPDAARVRRFPGADETLETVQDGIESDALVTLFGRCRVDYDGRAASRLGPGDRLVVLKPDGTILVHTDEGREPVNWQPPGCTHDPAVEDGEFVVRSQRASPDEELIVRFDRVVQVAAFEVTDTEDLSLSGTEEDLRERIVADPD
ncbi:MAG: endonuclease NucS, partial [Halanaeroarchaeum sp.]